MSNCFDFRHSNVERQTVLTLDSRILKSNCFDVLFKCRTSNCFDVRHSNVERQTTNVKPTSVPYTNRHNLLQNWS